MAAVLAGRVDAVVLSGGLARSPNFVQTISERVKYIGPIKVYPGEKEMEALALGVLRVLTGESEARIYGRPPAPPATARREESLIDNHFIPALL